MVMVIVLLPNGDKFDTNWLRIIVTNINDMVCIKGKLKEQLVHQRLPSWESLVSYQSLATSPSVNKS